MCPRWCGRYNPRAHPASFQSPSWLTTPTSMLVRTHPYQPFARRPVPSIALKEGGTGCKWSYLRYEVSLPSGAESNCLGWHLLLSSLRAGPGVCQTRQICEMPGCPAHTSRAHLHAPFPVLLSEVVPVPGGGPKPAAFSHLPPPARGWPHQSMDDMAGHDMNAQTDGSNQSKA